MEAGDGEGRARVAVVDDHAVLAGSLAAMVDADATLRCVGTAGTLREARELVATTSPDVLLLDQRLPDGDGIASIGDLLDLHPDMRIVVLTANAGDAALVAAIEAGAAGFMAKQRSLVEVMAAVRAAAAGEAVISPDLLQRLLPRLRRDGGGSPDELTERETEVLRYVGQGLTNAAIAEKLFVSVYTVRNHVANLSRKLGAHSKLEALTIGIRRGLVDPPSDHPD